MLSLEKLYTTPIIKNGFDRFKYKFYFIPVYTLALVPWTYINQPS